MFRGSLLISSVPAISGVAVSASSACPFTSAHSDDSATLSVQFDNYVQQQFGGLTIGRATYEPGWRWSENVKPLAGTDSCQVDHIGYMLEGRMALRMDDGTEREFGPGDAFHMPPGHDAWIVGDERCVLVDFGGLKGYAQAK